MGNFYYPLRSDGGGSRGKAVVMRNLDELLEIEGVIAAGEFTDDGKLVNYRSRVGMTDDAAALWAEMCAPVNVMFETLSEQFMRYSDMDWKPQKGWAFSGGEWTLAVGGHRGVLVETAKADFNSLYRILVQGE